MKLLSKDLAEYRELQWKKQDGMCPICNNYIESDDAVLDHDHDEGNCRMVLHRSCNTVEGKCKKDFIRYVSGRDGMDFVSFLENLTEYLKQDYADNPIHPTELTPKEKELKTITKRLKGLKRESAIQEYKARAKELRKLIKEEREETSWKK